MTFEPNLEPFLLRNLNLKILSLTYFAAHWRRPVLCTAAIAKHRLPRLLQTESGRVSLVKMMSQLVGQSACAPCTSVRSSSSLRGQQLHIPQRAHVQSIKRQIVATTKASGDTAQKPKSEPSDKEQQGAFKPPALDPSTPSPIFGGSTGGLLRMAQVQLRTTGHPC